MIAEVCGLSTIVNIKQLNDVVDKTVQAIEDGKNEIFEISERARTDVKTIEDELVEIQNKLKIIIADVDQLEIKEKTSRKKLLDVSKHFDTYNEKDIKKAYDTAKDLQIQLSLKRQEEKELFKERTRLEIRLKDSWDVLKNAENLTSKVGMALGLLRSGISGQLEDIMVKQDMGLRIIKAQEAERKRVSREIHDGPAQTMANIVIKSDYIERIIDHDMNEAKNEIHSLKEVVRDSLKNIRKIIYDLLPMSLSDLGLVPTIQRLVNDLEKDSGIKAAFKVKDSGHKLEPLVNLTVFRIIQECLTNIRKHADATQVQIKLEIDPDRIQIFVKDDGVGFNLDDISQNEDDDSGYGLYSMRERVDLLRGEFNLDTGKGAGTKIKAIIPLLEGEG